MLDTQNTQLPAPRVPVVDKIGQLMERSWYRFFSNFYNYFINLPRGTFYDTTTQTAAANTPKAITFNSSSDLRNMQIGTPTSRVVFDADGLTSVAFSIQFTNPASAEDNVFVWLRKNGVDVPYTASVATVPKKHGSGDGAAILSAVFQVVFDPGDYLELYWLTVTGTSVIQTIAATGSPAKPASPGVVLAINQVI